MRTVLATVAFLIISVQSWAATCEVNLNSKYTIHDRYQKGPSVTFHLVQIGTKVTGTATTGTKGGGRVEGEASATAINLSAKWSDESVWFYTWSINDSGKLANGVGYTKNMTIELTSDDNFCPQ